MSNPEREATADPAGSATTLAAAAIRFLFVQSD